MEVDRATGEFILDEDDRRLLGEERARVPFDDARTIQLKNQELQHRTEARFQESLKSTELAEEFAEQDREYCRAYGGKVLTLIRIYGIFPKPSRPEESE
jgi:hypothetical protein